MRRLESAAGHHCEMKRRLSFFRNPWECSRRFRKTEDEATVCAEAADRIAAGRKADASFEAALRQFQTVDACVPDFFAQLLLAANNQNSVRDDGMNRFRVDRRQGNDDQYFVFGL